MKNVAHSFHNQNVVDDRWWKTLLDGHSVLVSCGVLGFECCWLSIWWLCGVFILVVLVYYVVYTCVLELVVYYGWNFEKKKTIVFKGQSHEALGPHLKKYGYFWKRPNLRRAGPALIKSSNYLSNSLWSLKLDYENCKLML